MLSISYIEQILLSLSTQHIIFGKILLKSWHSFVSNVHTVILLSYCHEESTIMVHFIIQMDIDWNSKHLFLSSTKWHCVHKWNNVMLGFMTNMVWLHCILWDNVIQLFNHITCVFKPVGALQLINIFSFKAPIHFTLRWINGFFTWYSYWQTSEKDTLFSWMTFSSQCYQT